MNKHQLRGSIYISAGNTLKSVAGALQEAGQDGIKRREWYDCKKRSSKLIWFVLELTFLLLFYTCYCRVMARMKQPVNDWRGFAIFAASWYVFAFIRRCLRQRGILKSYEHQKQMPPHSTGAEIEKEGQHT